MKNRPVLSIIITSYNDREIIAPHFLALRKTLEGQSRYDWELIYVDDGSTDGSVEALRELSETHAHVTCVELSRNFGQQKAFLAGMKYARGDIVITLDGDYQYETDCLIQLADKVQEGFDLVSGIRLNRRDPLFSRITSLIGRFFVRRALRYPVCDFGSVKAYNRFLADKIILYENYCVMPHGMAFALTSRIAEIPVVHLPRHSGRSKWTFTRRLHMYFDLFLAYSPYESTSLVKIGVYSASLGTLTLVVLLYLFLAYGIFHFRSFTAVFALCLIGGGIALIFTSFLMSFLLRIYRQLLWRGNSYVLREIHGEDPVVRSISSQKL